ncbi:MAG: hypothetical protein IH591_14130, partial [Bacteroidales bacterium]|nr:hypothetical protein [Bacteroidales bacterium]
MKRLCSILLISTVGVPMLFAQTGPGGVGNSLNNLLWLKADAGVSTTTNGAPVSLWQDQSGNGNNASQAVANRQPKYVANATNGKPAILLNNVSDGVYDYLHLPTGFSNFTGGISALVVIRPIAPGDWDNFLNLDISSAPTTENIGLMRNGTSNSIFYEVYAGGTSAGSLNYANRITNGSYQIFGMRQDGGTPPGSTTARLYKDNAFLGSGTVSIPSNVVRDDNYIGHDSWGSGDMTAEIAEVIIYNFTMNRAQNYIIENYLSSKYGIALASNDYYSYDATHGNDVAGIGRLDFSNQHVNASSAAILNVSNPSSMGNGEYLLFGHDDEPIISWINTGTPSDTIIRLQRNWRFDETGNVGTISVLIDYSLLPAAPAACSNRYILVDGDGDFSSGATVYGLTLVSGNQYYVSGVSISDGDYVTVGMGAVPDADAGSDGSTCGSLSFSLGAVPSVGNGVWTKTSGPGDVVSWTPGNTSPTATVAVDSYGEYTFRWTETAGNCSDFDDVTIDFVQDVTAPVITCPADVTINCDDDSTPAGTGTATATDNCAVALNITITYTDVSTQDGDASVAGHYNYTITRTWRATDPSGNFSECDQ